MMTRNEALAEMLAVRQGLNELRGRRDDSLEALRLFLTRAGWALEVLGEPLAAQHCLAHGAGRGGSAKADKAFWALDLVGLFASAIDAAETERQTSTPT